MEEVTGTTSRPTARARFIEAALEAAKAGVVVVERDGRLAFANEAGRALLAEGTLSAPSGQPLETSDLPQSRALETGQVSAQLLVHEGRDGVREILVGEATPIRDDSGGVIGAVAAFVDADPHDLVLVLDRAPVGVGMLRGPELVFEYVNEAFGAIAPGVPLLGRPFAEAAPHLPQILERLAHLWDRGGVWLAHDLPLRIQRSPGEPLEEAWFSFVCRRVRRRHPPDALLAFVSETTERVRSQARLDRTLDAAHRRASELEAVIDTMLEGVVAYDRNRRMTLINSTARRMLEQIGLHPEILENIDELLRTLRLAHVDGAPLDASELPVQRALAGESCRVNIRYWNPTARRYGYATIGGAPIHAGNGGALVGVVTVGSDVTEETELDRLKDEFIRVIAHELKTPITVTKANSQWLVRSLGSSLSPSHVRMLQAIDRAADQIDRIMSELLDAQQIDLGLLTLILEPIDLGRLVEQVVGRVAADSPCHRVRSTAAPGVVVRADGRRLSEVMHILLDNAIRYSPDGGDVDVSVSLIEGDARVSVRDHGVGIPIERRDRLFQRFYRAHTGTPHDYGGTGLGLYVARTIVERHGGSIVFEPTEGGGSTFTFQFPTGTES